MMEYEPEPGADEGDLRENDPEAPGFAPEDRLFRSHFQHANKLADRAYEHVRGAYHLGYAAARDPDLHGPGFEQVEQDLEQGWLNVRTSAGDWASVRDFAREGFAQGTLGFMSETGALGETESHQRATFSDPLPDSQDPTSPRGPENEGLGARP